MTSLDEALQGTGAKKAFSKTSQIGDMVTGPIVDAIIRQRTDYVTQQPKFWDDGKPQNQVVVRVQTDQRVDQDDDGVRVVYIKTWGPDKEALLAAIKQAGGSKASDVLKPGAIFTATFTGTQPSGQGDPTKLYNFEINPNGAALDQAVTQTEPQQPVQAAAQHVATAEDDQVKKIAAKQLITLGQQDAAIAQVTGLELGIIAAIRNTI